jgi:hypothetical protein
MAKVSFKSLVVGAGLFLATSLATNAADYDIYNNSTHRATNSDGAISLKLANGVEVGYQLNLSSSYTPAPLSSFSFELYISTLANSSGATMQVSLYDNTGALSSGVPSPANSILDNTFNLYNAWSPNPTNALTVRYTDLAQYSIQLPSTFTLAVKVTGLGGSDEVGLALYDTTTVGTYYADYWKNSGSSWTLNQLKDGNGNVVVGSVGAVFTVPEPSTWALASLGGTMFLIVLIRRRTQSTKA